jgi:hypothetical protein
MENGISRQQFYVDHGGSGDGCAGPDCRVWAGMRYPSEQLCIVSAADHGADVQFAPGGLAPGGHFLRRFTARKRNCLRAAALSVELIKRSAHSAKV